MDLSGEYDYVDVDEGDAPVEDGPMPPVNTPDPIEDVSLWDADDPNDPTREQ